MGRMLLALVSALVVVGVTVVFVDPVREEVESTVLGDERVISNATIGLRERARQAGDRVRSAYREKFGAEDDTSTGDAPDDATLLPADTE